MIAALLARKHVLVFERRTGMLHGWGMWMRGLRERLGPVPHATADAMVALLAARPPMQAAAAAPALSRWQVLRLLFYPGWDPPLREERGLRWLAGVTSLFMHLLFALLLVLVAMVRVPAPPQQDSDATRVQVDFIGEGTPELEAGGPPDALAGEVQPVAPPVAAPEPQTSVASAAEAAEQVPSPAPPEPAVQTLQVTETDDPSGGFVLPPPTPPAPDWVVPTREVPEPVLPQREVVVVRLPPSTAPGPAREVSARALPAPEVAVRERAIPAPLAQVSVPQLPTQEVAVPSLRPAIPSLRQATIPAPGPRPAAAPSAVAPAQATGAGAAPADSGQAAGVQDQAQASGPATLARDGGGPAPVRGDDWGAATSASPGTSGTSDGLFNADGSVRLPGALGSEAAPGAGPPGSSQAQRSDADRAAKWLARPRIDYEPTMFDEYWKPTNESLLAEWVRRSVREVEIPIPGTSKKVRCVVSVLMAGGACTLFDPNLNEQPASARPPPDIPVKRNPIPTDS